MAHRQTVTATSQKEIIAVRPDLLVAVPATVAADAVLGTLDVGTVMGRKTSGSKLRRVTRAPVKTGGAFATNSATGSVVGASVIFKAGDVLVVGSSGAAVGTIQSIAGDVITLTGNATTALAQGLDIKASDGAEVAVGILREVTDALVLDRQVALVIGGYLTESKLVGLTTQAKTELGMTSRANDIVRF
jgi:hypothetical protein